MRQRQWAKVLVVTLGLCSPSLTTAAIAQSLISAAAISISAESEIASALYSASATQEAIQRSADDRIRSLRTEIDGLRAEASRLKASGTAQGQAAEAARAELSQAEQRFVAELALRDRAYGQEIAVFRSSLETIAADPERLKALAQYNEGDRRGAVAILDELDAALAAALEARKNIEIAARRRNTAQVALDARQKGDFTTADLIARYEEITALDPGVHLDWVELSRLYMSAGRLVFAKEAADQAVSTALDDHEEAVALSVMGDVNYALGDGPEALRVYQDSLSIRERLAASDTSNFAAQRDLSEGLYKVAAVLKTQGNWSAAKDVDEQIVGITHRRLWDKSQPDWMEAYSELLNLEGSYLHWSGDSSQALAAFSQALLVAENLAAADPYDMGRQRNLAEALERVGLVQTDQRDARGALATYFRSQNIWSRLATTDPTNLDWLKAYAACLEKMGELFASQGQLLMALNAHAEALAIYERLVASDPSNALWWWDVWRSLLKVGDLTRGMDDGRALELYHKGLEIAERLAANDPSSVAWQWNLIVSNVRLADATTDNSYLVKARQIVSTLQANGKMRLEDEWTVSGLMEGASGQ